MRTLLVPMTTGKFIPPSPVLDLLDAIRALVLAFEVRRERRAPRRMQPNDLQIRRHPS